jgi:protein involved in polysaccharide export with SLBB domain
MAECIFIWELEKNWEPYKLRPGDKLNKYILKISSLSTADVF